MQITIAESKQESLKVLQQCEIVILTRTDRASFPVSSSRAGTDLEHPVNAVVVKQTKIHGLISTAMH